MTTFDDRESAFETKFAHDAEMQFKANARRDKLLGLWAAKLMGKTGVEVQTYTAAVVNSNLKEPGDEDVYQKLMTDLQDRVTEEELRSKMTELLAVAQSEIMSEL